MQSINSKNNKALECQHKCNLQTVKTIKHQNVNSFLPKYCLSIGNNTPVCDFSPIAILPPYCAFTAVLCPFSRIASLQSRCVLFWMQEYFPFPDDKYQYPAKILRPRSQLGGQFVWSRGTGQNLSKYIFGHSRPAKPIRIYIWTLQGGGQFWAATYIII